MKDDKKRALFSVVSVDVLSLLSFCLAHAVTLNSQAHIVQCEESAQQVYFGKDAIDS
jgi:hypothetical protein